ncbi:MAG: flagellar biosynthesis protein FliQ [Chloroflexi bacterium]|nr:flagellar biosynthesis protein FliQ [Chloroflexota bacterium]
MLATIARDTLLVTIELSMPILAAGLIVGVLISLFQAVTQISELTLTFVPKLLSTILIIVILGPWMLQTILRFTSDLFSSLPLMVR